MTNDQDLVRLGRRYQRLRSELDEIRPALAAEIRAAADSGMPQKEIVKATGYTREMVRRIVRGEAA